MAIDFPNSPSTGDFYTVDDRTWRWDGYKWAIYATNLSQSNYNAKGDLLVGTGNDTVGTLSVGVDGKVLVADSSASTGVAWSSALDDLNKGYINPSSITSTEVYDVNDYPRFKANTSDTTSDFVLNFRGDASTTYDSISQVGYMGYYSYIAKHGNTAYALSGVEIDGVTQTVLWEGGIEPQYIISPLGNAYSEDIYRFTIIKLDAAPTYKVIATLIETALPAGNAVFDEPGSYLWTAPAGVTSVCVVCVGGGGGGAYSTAGGGGGGGGGLGWKNDIPVIPGNNYSVVVGAGGTSSTSGSDGNQSYFINNSTVAGFGGQGGVLVAATNSAGGSHVGDGGGSGGAGGNYAAIAYAGGGGGAGGYSGNGGDGGNAGATAGTSAGDGSGGGGGGGGCGGSADTAGSGGGVGIYGEGASGVGGFNSGADGTGGYGGSGGGNASNTQVSFVSTNTYSTTNKSTPGAYGGGAGGSDTTLEMANGANGVVRILWGVGRAFPSTNTELA